MLTDAAQPEHRLQRIVCRRQIWMVVASKSLSKLAILMAMSVSEQMPLADVKDRKSVV